MSVYVMSDIHGDYDRYIKMLEKINFSNEDKLFILGDVIDRGKHSIKILQDMMLRPNIFPILGNHEYMAINSLKFLCQEVTDDTINQFSPDLMRGILQWQAVGGSETIDEFRKLSQEEKEDVFDYLYEFSLYEEIKVNGTHYILVHAGLNDFDIDKPLSSYSLRDMIFDRLDYSKVYFPDKILITGHTPTRYINGEDKIYKANNHIAIDCGCGYGFVLSCLCLNTMEEFYV